MNSLTIGTFTKSILLEVAQSLGYLEQEKLEVSEFLVPSSPAQFEALERGEIELAVTNPDNVLAYRYLSKNPLGRNFDVRILAAVDRGLGLSLCYAPGLSGAPKTFGVDVPTSGFAFVGYSLLQKEGLAPGYYSIVALGSTPKRGLALMESQVDATILNAGNEIRALAGGATKIADVGALGPYIGTVFATIGSPSENAQKFIKIVQKVSSEILEGAYQDLIIEIAARNLKLDYLQARAHYEVFLDPRQGLVKNGVVDQASIQTLIDLRQEFAPSQELEKILLDLPALLNAE